jgi:hypothetical protein
MDFKEIYLYSAASECRCALEHGPRAYAKPFVSLIAGWFQEAS